MWKYKTLSGRLPKSQLLLARCNALSDTQDRLYTTRITQCSWYSEPAARVGISLVSALPRTGRPRSVRPTVWHRPGAHQAASVGERTTGPHAAVCHVLLPGPQLGRACVTWTGHLLLAVNRSPPCRLLIMWRGPGTSRRVTRPSVSHTQFASGGRLGRCSAQQPRVGAGGGNGPRPGQASLCPRGSQGPPGPSLPRAPRVPGTHRGPLPAPGTLSRRPLPPWSACPDSSHSCPVLPTPRGPPGLPAQAGRLLPQFIPTAARTTRAKCLSRACRGPGCPRTRSTTQVPERQLRGTVPLQLGRERQSGTQTLHVAEWVCGDRAVRRLHREVSGEKARGTPRAAPDSTARGRPLAGPSGDLTAA